MCKEAAQPQDSRDGDCDENLRSAYFDSTEDEDSGRRFQKPMSATYVAVLRQRDGAH